MIFREYEQDGKKGRAWKLALFLAIVFFTTLIYHLFLSPPSDFPIDSTAVIKNGESSVQIATRFKELKIIRSSATFQFFVIFLRDDRRIVAGDYYFVQPLPVWNVAKRVVSGKFFTDPARVTLPEGLTTEQMVEIFSEKLRDFDRDKFLELVLSEEGRLFPDTYFFWPSAPVTEVFETLQKNYNARGEPLRAEITASGRTENDILIMASIIEREAGSVEEMPIIAGILWKRLEKKMPLQADAAPVTYERLGLPEAPINNPGIVTIQAALRPEESPYFYYLHDKDGNIHYAKTLVKHGANKRKYLK